MLDRRLIKEFLEEEFKFGGIIQPETISMDEITEAFCQYTEDDYFEWLRDNYKSFFNYDNPNWNWIIDTVSFIRQSGKTLSNNI